MADRLRLAILWHMHQPSYRNRYEETYAMPLAFLHATKDYYDMLQLAAGVEGVRVCFNLVPSLMDQLEGYSRGPQDDAFLTVLLKPTDSLEEDEVTYLLDFLFLGDVRHMILPLKRYYQLFDRRERSLSMGEPELLFTAQELLDLEVLFLLAWTGPAYRREEQSVRELIRKGRDFTQAEKEGLVTLLLGRVSGILGAYRTALEAGRVEITTTPYYHPILPLLMDFNSARATDRGVPLPVSCGSLGQDAPLHVDKALSRYKDVFGRDCRGMWPAEGAVSAESLELMASRGIRFAASDEEVLANSLGLPYPGFGDRRLELFRPHNLSTAKGDIALFFRDRGLSDLIGFSYQRMGAKAAVAHFLAKLDDIRRFLTTNDGLVSVILDGENAWEHYPENGREFLLRFYEGLTTQPGLEMVTFEKALEEGQKGSLGRVVAGSWIGGRLNTWVGHPEKNRAWEMVCRARSDLVMAQEKSKPGDWESAREQLLTAEGSDWFWWFGDDHFSTISDRFDELFRLHLINMYRFLGNEVPPNLLEPIKRKHPRGHIRSPLDHIYPVVDGRVTSYFEWLNAGQFDLNYEQGSMHRSDAVLLFMHYGFDESRLFLRLDSDDGFSERLRGRELAIEVVAPVKRRIAVRVLPDGTAALDPADREAGVGAAIGSVAEFAVPLRYLSAAPGGEVLLSFSIWQDGQPVEKAPLFSLVKLIVPDQYDLVYWMV